LTLDKKDDMDLFSKLDFHQWNDRWQVRLERQAISKDESRALMQSHNPAIIPRNHRVEEVLDAAEKGDLSLMNTFLRVLHDPYGYTPGQEEYSRLPEPSPYRYQTFCGT
jgi:uncharacterized protein YdiU (UPF0061 family)